VTDEENAIKEIRVKWDRQKAPKVVYVMSGWNWSATEIPQKDIVRKIGEYHLVNGHLKKELASDISRSEI
jgi:hypothetical protein